jgi:hypothetical protein
MIPQPRLQHEDERENKPERTEKATHETFKRSIAANLRTNAIEALASQTKTRAMLPALSKCPVSLHAQ